MENGGVIPTDSLDPSIESEARLQAVPFPVFELKQQPSLTRAPIIGFTESTSPAGRDDLSVSFSYTLWKYPDDHTDPRNEVELDERTRRALDEEPPWGRPAWLIEQTQIFRYPMLWEAVRTAWHASSELEQTSLRQQLIGHTNYVLQNRFREELASPADPSDTTGWEVAAAAITNVTVNVDGRDRPAIQIDTDPFVYSVAFGVDEHVVCTTVLPRDSLPYLDIALATYERL